MFRTLSKTAASRNNLRVATRPASNTTLPTDKLKLALRNLQGDAKFVQSLHGIRTSSLYTEVWEWANLERYTASKSVEAHTNPQLRNAAAAYTICYTLDAVVHLSQKYDLKLAPTSLASDPQVLEKEFLAQIKPSHAKLLIGDFQRAWNRNSTLRQAAILSALRPEVIKKLGLERTSAHAELEATWGPIPEALQLSEAEFFALIDYLNSQTGTFNAINGAAMADAYYHEPVLNRAVGAFSAALDRAIDKLCRHPYFGKRNIKTYKGIKLTEQAGSFRYAMLKVSAKEKRIVAFPNVVSATSNPHKSYAFLKAAEGYLLELLITMLIGFDADPFHDQYTMGECEILGPRGQKFLITNVEEIEVPMEESGSWFRIERYVLDPKV